jgi:hypothetical protein
LGNDEDWEGGLGRTIEDSNSLTVVSGELETLDTSNPSSCVKVKGELTIFQVGWIRGGNFSLSWR